MTARPRVVCDIPGAHSGPVRLYPCGPRCTTHAPQPRTRTGANNPQGAHTR